MAVNNLNIPGTGIQPTLVDAKGDLIAGVANDAVNRLAVGTNGQVLVADSGETTGLKWNNPGTVGGLVHINTTTVSAAAGINLDNVFSSAFTNYLVIPNLTPAGTGSVLQLRFRTSGSDNSNSNYQSARFGAANTTVFGSVINNNSTAAQCTSDNYAGGFTRLEIYRPNLSANTVWYWQQYVGSSIQTNSSGEFNATTVFDGFSLTKTAGTLTGQVRVYGYKD